jgi:hypothetical protein
VLSGIICFQDRTSDALQLPHWVAQLPGSDTIHRRDNDGWMLVPPAMTASHSETDMQQISERERILLRLGSLVVILITLWVFGLLRSGPIVVYWTFELGPTPKRCRTDKIILNVSASLSPHT